MIRIIKDIRKLFDFLFSKNCTISLGDIICKNNNLKYITSVIVMRYYDVADYYKGNSLFIRKNTVGQCFRGGEFDALAGNNKFIKLIDSYEKRGYDENSYILLDQNLNVINGTHRIAMNLHAGYDHINAKVVYRLKHNTNTINLLYEKGVPSSLLSCITQEYYDMLQLIPSKGLCFCAYIQGELKSSDGTVAIIDDIKSLTEVIKIYNIDNGLIISFIFVDPHYKISKSNYYCTESERLAEVLEKRIKGAKMNTTIEISRNTLEGKRMLEKYHLFTTN